MIQIFLIEESFNEWSSCILLLLLLRHLFLYNRNSVTIAYGFNFFPNYERKDIDLVRRYNTYTTIW
jgi:hypothetical protein